MSMTHAQKAILQATQKKQNCNLVQERKYDDYGDYGDVHGDYYDCDCGTAQPEARSAAKTDSGQECKYDDYGDYGDAHGDYYDFDCQEEIAVRPEQSVKSPIPNILERTKNRLFQNTK